MKAQNNRDNSDVAFGLILYLRLTLVVRLLHPGIRASWRSTICFRLSL